MKLFFQAIARTVLSCSALLAVGGASVQAQSLSLVPSTTTVSVNGTVTFTLKLTPASGGSTNLNAYDTNVFINGTYLTFVGTTPYTQTAAGTANFADGALGPNNVMRTFGDGSTPVITYPTGTNKRLRVVFYTTDFVNGGTILTPTALGTFSVKAISPLPTAGALVTLGPIGVHDTNSGDSDLTNLDGDNILSSVGPAVKLTPAPEPAIPVVFLIGALTLAFSGLYRFRTAAISH